MARKKKKSSSKKSRRVKTIRAFKLALTNPRQRIAIPKKTIRCLYRWGRGLKA